MTDIETQWVAIEPGTIVLPTTKFRITYGYPFMSFRLTWGDHPMGLYIRLIDAQERAKVKLQELITMGIEP